MKVILKQDIKGIGRKYEIKNVADGYANNFLIPKKLAEYASPDAVKKAEALRVATLAEMEIKEKLTEKQIETLKGIKVVLKKKSNEKGHLFEQVHADEIAEALKTQAGVEVGSESLIIKEPIKTVGEHQVSVQIGKNKGEFKVIIEVA